MKKVSTFLNKVSTLPVVLVGVLVILGAGVVSAAILNPGDINNPSVPQIQNTVPFIPASQFATRLGTLAIGHTVVPNWVKIYSGDRCLHINFLGANSTKAQTCLDVNGSAVFPRLVVRPAAQVAGNVVVGSSFEEEGGGKEGGFFEATFTPFVVKGNQGSTLHSMLLSSLGRWTGGGYAPQNTTRQRKVCAFPGTVAQGGGKLVVCPAGFGGTKGRL